MSPFSSCILAALIAGGTPFAGAQPPAGKPEIRGTVFEDGSSRPLSGANVNIYYLGNSESYSPAAKGEAIAKMVTGEGGTFAHADDRAGAYLIEVGKEGYTRPRRVYRAPATSPIVRLKAGQPVPEVRIPLTRPGTIAGRLIDDETRQPLAGKVAYAEQVEYRNGGLMTWGLCTGTTDAEGRFVCKDVPPGLFVLNTRPRKMEKDLFLTRFTPKDAEVVDLDDEEQIWPGGGTWDSALPMTLLPGGELDLGTVRVKKVKYYRVRVQTKGSGCQAVETLQVSLWQVFSDQRRGGGGSGTVPCGGELLIKGFRPAMRYRLIIAVAVERPRVRQASVPIDVTDKNVTTGFTLGKGVTLTIRFRAAEGAKLPDLSRLNLGLEPMEGIPFGSEVKLPRLNAENELQRENVQPGLYSFLISRFLAPAHVVQDVLYNGTSIGSGPLHVAADAVAQVVEVVISDKPASVSGTVGVRGKATAEAAVVLVRVPYARDQSPYPRTPETTAGQDGQFQFTGLAPGTYRLIAMTPDGALEMQKPGRLLAALDAASDIVLAEGAVRTVNLEPVQ